MILSENKENIYTVAFCNIENLFDVNTDVFKMDDDFTIKDRRRWSVKRYKKKVKNISTVLTKIGGEKSLYPPSLVGLVEIYERYFIGKRKAKGRISLYFSQSLAF
ncbi:hypothetical protein PL373_05215 [Tenacibaculum maritimum]|nr:hypothetical protein [Tenacibaculum maritimum]MDB0600551.1 hypothetical protein [Tenacibaculum maritimum]MDB0612223.1 hypothetical protein [Tenacibaculum maritimum]